MNIVLVEPEIAPNTGNIARLCASTQTQLHLIEPFGFKLDDRQLKRAGMDYWEQVQWHRWPNWSAFRVELPVDARLWFIESEGPRRYSDVAYKPDDYLVFGRAVIDAQDQPRREDESPRPKAAAPQRPDDRHHDQRQPRRQARHQRHEAVQCGIRPLAVDEKKKLLIHAESAACRERRSLRFQVK